MIDPSPEDATAAYTAKAVTGGATMTNGTRSSGSERPQSSETHRVTGVMGSLWHRLWHGNGKSSFGAKPTYPRLSEGFASAAEPLARATVPVPLLRG